MTTKKTFHYLWILVLALAIASCSTATAQESTSPEQLVNDYYNWYLDNLGYDPDTDEFQNPLQDGSYQLQGSLSTEFIDRIEEMKAEGLPADPILCAQDVPESFTIQEVDISPMGEEARVSVETSFEGHQFQVYLQKLSGEWKIAGVICMPNNRSSQTQAE
jgi:hypothetical protein